MAPSAVETPATTPPAPDRNIPLPNNAHLQHQAHVPVQRVKNPDGTPLYPAYMPFYDPLEKVDDLGPFTHHDPGHRADPALPNLLRLPPLPPKALVGPPSSPSSTTTTSSASTVKLTDLSPHVGTEIDGVQLSQLSPAGLDEVALLAAQRGALVFRNQDFNDIGFERQKAIAGHFGPLHVHGWAPHPVAGSPEHMIIYDSQE